MRHCLKQVCFVVTFIWELNPKSCPGLSAVYDGAGVPRPPPFFLLVQSPCLPFLTSAFRDIIPRENLKLSCSSLQNAGLLG